MSRKTKEKPAAAKAQSVDKDITITPGMAVGIYFGLALIYFAPAFFPGRHIWGSDYTDAGYMMYEFGRQRIHSGALPKWVPGIVGGVPMFANPGSTF